VDPRSDLSASHTEERQGVQFSVLTAATGAYPIVKECYSAERYVNAFLNM